MSDTPYSVDRLTGVYIKIRSAIAEMKERHKEELSELEEKLEMVSEQLLEICNDQEVDSLRTSQGTVSRRVASRFWTSDWDSFYEFVKEHDAPYLLEQRIHKANMKQFLEENPDAVPMGLQTDNRYVIYVRKPTAK